MCILRETEDQLWNIKYENYYYYYIRPILALDCLTESHFEVCRLCR